MRLPCRRATIGALLTTLVCLCLLPAAALAQATISDRQIAEAIVRDSQQAYNAAGLAAQAIADGVARFGRIDTLVNNAGIFIAKPFTEYTEADYAAILGVNLTGFFHITQRAVVEMEKRQSGHIVQITTTLVDSANSQVQSRKVDRSHAPPRPAEQPFATGYCPILPATARGPLCPRPSTRRITDHPARFLRRPQGVSLAEYPDDHHAASENRRRRDAPT
jgi:NAD(P)-dependent dehydrogenase (short-subunit alcohol dehydrogenase family)